MLNLKIYTRFRSNSPVYLDICKEEWEKYEKCSDELAPYFDGDSWFEKVKEVGLLYINSITDEKWKCLMKAVTFGAMCLEAFIYDYAAHNFSDTYVKRYLDKLDVVSKWVVIPRFVTGKDFPRESKAFEDLRRLIKERNDLVHAKSTPLPKSIWQGEIKEIINKLGPRAKKDFETERHFTRVSPSETVIEILTELRKLEGENEIGTQWWQLEEAVDEKNNK